MSQIEYHAIAVLFAAFVEEQSLLGRPLTCAIDAAEAIEQLRELLNDRDDGLKQRGETLCIAQDVRIAADDLEGTAAASLVRPIAAGLRQLADRIEAA